MQSHLLDCMVGLRSIGRIIYVYIYLYSLCIHIYVDTDTRPTHTPTHTPPTPTPTTTPHMLVTGTRIKRDNKYTARAASLSIKNIQYARTGVRASSPTKLKYPLDTNAKCFPEQLTYDT
ncbi:unnamed protein product [Pipistrellus nathusii]|uniref:Uncharacterized protein n=1 Tax=Pipistrellus nathusii TaxID=59473 RepID=A0ABP0A179_PIPNA